MASASRSTPLDNELEFEEIYNPKPGHTLPGYTVDALLADGKVDEARDELERLLQEGIDSGPGREMNEELFQEIMAKARVRAGRTTG